MLPNGNDVREVYFGNEGKAKQYASPFATCIVDVVPVSCGSISGIFPNGFAGPNRSKDCLYLVDCSTIGPKITQEVRHISFHCTCDQCLLYFTARSLIHQLSHRVFCLGHHHVDAPVTGGVIGKTNCNTNSLNVNHRLGAEKATLSFLCGGQAEDVDVRLTHIR